MVTINVDKILNKKEIGSDVCVLFSQFGTNEEAQLLIAKDLLSDLMPEKPKAKKGDKDA